MQNNLSNISTIIFDFGGALIDLDRQAAINAFEQLGVRHIDHLLNDYLQAGIFQELEKGTVSPAEFRDFIRTLTPQQLSDRQIDAAWCAFVRDIPPAKLDLLLMLRKRYRVLMLSNTNQITFAWCAATKFNYRGHSSIDDFFDCCYLSYEMGLLKPQPEIFQELLSRENIAAEACLFLDDGLINITVAESLGFHTQWVEQHTNLNSIFTPLQLC
jgi:putative hydrolase of the HAD superfamily